MTGWHQGAGSPHAEVDALGRAGESARGATAYVSLEPCTHTGRTGPCADALIEAGISTVVYAVADPSDPDDAVDVDAARRIDGLHNRFFLDPVFRGSYPDDVLEDTAHLRFDGRPWADVVHDGDLAAIAAPIDVLGVNYYHGDEVSGHQRTDVVGAGAPLGGRHQPHGGQVVERRARVGL